MNGNTMSMGIVALIIGIVLAALGGAFMALSMCLFVPFIIIGSIIAFVLSIFVPPLRQLGIIFLLFSIGLFIGLFIHEIVARALL